jgi:hypothetical protein
MLDDFNTRAVSRAVEYIGSGWRNGFERKRGKNELNQPHLGDPEYLFATFTLFLFERVFQDEVRLRVDRHGAALIAKRPCSNAPKRPES